MSEQQGLREQRERRTRDTINAAEMSLFFDEVDPRHAALADAARRCAPGDSVLPALQQQIIYQLTAGRTDAVGQPLAHARAQLQPLIGQSFSTLRTGLGPLVKVGAPR